jgi:diguanylate cyclase (GGDEF)-like protein
MERLSDLAFRDDLSGLLNRTAARAAIEETLRFGESEIVALFMIDIDNFKQVNDTLGHQMGDEALVRISGTIKNMFRATDMIARIGGDEFFVFLPDATSLGIVQTKVEALCDALRFTFTNGIQSAAISSSIGVIVAKRDQIDYETLYSEADYALYEAKNAGKNRYCIRRQDTSVETDRMRISGSAYSVQLYTLLKHMDGGLTILEVGDTIRARQRHAKRCGIP